MYFLVEIFGLVKERSHISQRDKKILWINWAAPSLGDSLMDLSSRIMLKNYEVVLLTHPKNVELYSNDPIFQEVFSNTDVIIDRRGINAFDLVICDAFSPRVMMKKIRVAPLVPFVGIYGYINGFEVHRTYFLFARMAELLRISKEDFPAGVRIKPYLKSHVGPTELVDFDVCIAIGGEWKFRTYSRWNEVIRELNNHGYSIKLVGSANGRETAISIQRQFPEVRSLVGEITLTQTLKEIETARVFLGCDGGLWHCATALGKPSVVLFSDCQLFDERGRRVTRETTDIETETLYASSEVSSIPSSEVVKAAKRLLGAGSIQTA
jgi:hypothetical protein